MNDDLDPKLLHIYQQIPKEQPSQAVDSAILQAAQQPIANKTYWRPVWGIAASVVMMSSLVWYWQAQQPQELTRAVAVSEPQAAEAPPAVTDEVRFEERAVIAADDFTDDTQSKKEVIAEKKITSNKPAAPSLQAKSLISNNENLAFKEELKQSPAAAPVAALEKPQPESDLLGLPPPQKTKAVRKMAASPSLEDGGASSLEAKSEELNTKINVPQAISSNNQIAIERVRGVFNKNFAQLNTVYQQAFKEDANLEQGVVRFKLIIDEKGTVASCMVASSTLNNPELEAKFVEIVKKFNFGEAIEEWRGTYPVYFYHQ